MPEAEVVDAAVVRDDGEVLRPELAQRADAVLGDAAEAEAAGEDVAPSGMSRTASTADGTTLFTLATR